MLLFLLIGLVFFELVLTIIALSVDLLVGALLLFCVRGKIHLYWLLPTMNLLGLAAIFFLTFSGIELPMYTQQEWLILITAFILALPPSITCLLAALLLNLAWPKDKPSPDAYLCFHPAYDQMSLSPNEMITQRSGIEAAEGTVVIGGLGLAGF